MEFERLEWDEQARHSTVIDTVVIPCDDVILAIGQENAFPWIERDLGLEFGEWDMPVVDPVTFQSSLPGVFFGGDSAMGPEEHHLGGGARSPGCDLDPQPLRGHPGRPHGRRRGSTSSARRWGSREWSYHNDYNPSTRQRMQHVELTRALQSIGTEVEVGFSAEQTAREVQRCLNCDIQTVFQAPLCIECDACIDICPVQCLTITENGEEADLRARLNAPAKNLDQALYVSAPLPQTGRVMVKDEDLCVHCGLCAERCPTAAWDMQKFELLIPLAVSTPVPVPS